MNTEALLPTTTLAAIVRDEERNPAGGIEEWIYSPVRISIFNSKVDRLGMLINNETDILRRRENGDRSQLLTGN